MKTLILSLGSLFMSSFLSADTILPREDLFKPSACIGVRVSPDGKRIAYVGGDDQAATNLFVSSNLSMQGAKQVTHCPSPEIRLFKWAPDNKSILLLKDTDGTRLYHLYKLDVTTGELKDLTAKYDRIVAKIFKMSESENKAIVGINARNPKFHDLYSVDINTGELTLLFQNDEFINFVFDENLQVQIKIRMNPDSSHTLIDKNGEVFLELTAEDAFNTETLLCNAQENAFYLLDTRGSDTTQLKKILLNSKKEILLGHDLKSDIFDVVFEAGRPIAYSSYYTEKTWHPLNEKSKADIEWLNSKVGRNFEIHDQSTDGQFWVIKNSIPEKGGAFYLYRRGSKTLSTIYEAKGDDRLAKMLPIVIPARDGLPLVCYLTIPKELDVGGNPKHPVPLVVIPHGGPFKARDLYGCNPYHQWLASRGYAVLNVNFRLSSGFGKAFVNAGNGEWGGKAHLDILDAVQWCVDQKIADKDKLAIWGGSYGGYEALVAMTFTPTVFACGVAMSGPSNLKTILEKISFYWETPNAPLSEKTSFFTKNAFIISMGGSPDNEKELAHLQSRSPLNFVDRIQRPMLLMHGNNDPIIPASESDQIVETMKQRECKVIYMKYPDEGHGLVKFANLMTFLAHSEWLFTNVLGGAFEPLKEDLLRRSTAKIEAFGMNPRGVTQAPEAALEGVR